jgi:hypothetical protein
MSFRDTCSWDIQATARGDRQLGGAERSGSPPEARRRPPARRSRAQRVTTRSPTATASSGEPSAAGHHAVGHHHAAYTNERGFRVVPGEARPAVRLRHHRDPGDRIPGNVSRFDVCPTTAPGCPGMHRHQHHGVAPVGPHNEAHKERSHTPPRIIRWKPRGLRGIRPPPGVG